jgi:hypothetical protein
MGYGELVDKQCEIETDVADYWVKARGVAVFLGGSPFPAYEWDIQLTLVQVWYKDELRCVIPAEDIPHTWRERIEDCLLSA